MRARLRAAEARGAVLAARLLVARGWIDWALRPGGPAPPVGMVVALGARVHRVVPARAAGGECLVRAVAVALLLVRRGYRVQVRVGCRTGAGGLEAHAWIEAEGRILVGDLPDIETYHPVAPRMLMDLRGRIPIGQ